MIAKTCLDLVIWPSLAMLDAKFATREASMLLLAIALQESNLEYVRQIPSGPARGLWQTEPQTAEAVVNKWEHGAYVLAKHGYSRMNIYRGIEADPFAACIVARGILALDPLPLPAIGDIDAAWTYYADRTWRPGKPRRDKWATNYRLAQDVVLQ